MQEKRLPGDALFSIGEISKLFHMNIRTLRYYDDIGILKPALVNPETNYRYYSTEQFERLNAIRYLRALDVPLAKIAEFFEEKDVDTMLSLFIEQREDVRQRKLQLERIESKITNRIEQIESAVSADFGRITVKSLPPRRIVLLEKSFTYADDLEPLIRDLSKDHSLDEAIFLGKVGMSISQQDLLNAQFGSFSSIFIVIEDEDDTPYCDDILPEGSYATTQYQGTHKDAPPYYASLMKYLASEGLQVTGNSVEITLIDAGMTNDASKFTTELQVPFR